jgi:DNA gyrase subunit B
MERDFGAELDNLKEELHQLRKQLLQNYLPKVIPHSPKAGQEMLDVEGRQQLDGLLKQLVAYASNHSESGAIAYTGTFSSGDEESTQQSIWASTVPTDHLLKLNDNRLVEKVLTSVGNTQRLAILLALLRKPKTVAQLVAETNAKTTGQVYHHLKPLVSADIIKEDKGVYAVIPYRVQGIIMLLTGVWDLVDTRYTSGTWEE